MKNKIKNFIKRNFKTVLAFVIGASLALANFNYGPSSDQYAVCLNFTLANCKTSGSSIYSLIFTGYGGTNIDSCSDGCVANIDRVGLYNVDTNYIRCGFTL